MVSAVMVIPLGYLFFPVAHFLANSTDLLIMLSTEINRLIISLPLAYSVGKYNLLLAAMSSGFSIYLFTFKHLHQFYFRFAVVVLSTFAIFFFLQTPVMNKQRSAVIYPLKDIAVAEVPLSGNKIFYYVADRKNKQMPKADYRLADYLASKMDNGSNIILGLSGNVGIATYDFLKNKYSVKMKPVSLLIGDQKRIEALLGLRKRLPQITNKIEI